MGKSLVIKGANFASSSLEQVVLTPVQPSHFVDITNSFAFTDGRVVISDGSQVISAFNCASDYTDVSGYSMIRLAQPMYRVGPIGPSYGALCFYDADKNFISSEFYNLTNIEGIPSTEIVDHVLPAGTKYVRTNYWMDSYEEQWPSGHYIPFSCLGLTI